MSVALFIPNDDHNVIIHYDCPKLGIGVKIYTFENYKKAKDFYDEQNPENLMKEHAENTEKLPVWFSVELRNTPNIELILEKEFTIFI